MLQYYQQDIRAELSEIDKLLIQRAWIYCYNVIARAINLK